MKDGKAENPLKSDLNHVLHNTEGLWDALRGQKIFLTGGTGFFGRWLLETFSEANRVLDLGAEAWVLSRSPEVFEERNPAIATQPAIHLLKGDVRDFRFPEGKFAYVIHAASPAGTDPERASPLDMIDMILRGTRRVLEFAASHKTRSLLLTSSGAVYGEQPVDLPEIPETFSGSPGTLSPLSAYGEGKRLAEFCCAEYSRRFNFQAKIARGFAFVGPHLPLGEHYAIGNFIRDALGGGPIVIRGDGTPLRSYLYAADLSIWLWTILIRGRPLFPYNVGSDQAIKIADLARTVAETVGDTLAVEFADPAVMPEQRRIYVPSIQRARSELGLKPLITLREAILRTASFYRDRIQTDKTNGTG